MNEVASTAITSGIIFAALVTLGSWIFKWFAKRLEKKDKRAEEKDEIIREMTADIFDHMSASTNAMNLLVEQLREMRGTNEAILNRVTECPRRNDP